MSNLAFKETLNKVPDITLLFWVVKILSTTVGETFADYLNVDRHLGLSGTTFVMSVLLAISLTAQMRAKRYFPSLYWLVVVFISVVGTLITDNLTDNLNVSLWVSSAIFATALSFSFYSWYKQERTLSVHDINTPRREIYYWITILLAFALGTALGDLVAEKISLGYLVSAIMFLLMIFSVSLAQRLKHFNSVLTFWIAYILTRPLGASVGDFLSQDKEAGGIGLGATSTSFIFLALILISVAYLTLKSHKDNKV